MTTSRSVMEVFLDCLKQEGIRQVFGVPGGLLLPFFDAVERDPDLNLVVAKHECGAAFMADGYARVGGSIAVVAATSGPGQTNLLTGVAVAHADGVPMLVLTGQAPIDALGKGAAQETPPEDVDVVSMLRRITKYSAMVMSPAKLTHHFRRAMRLALTGRPGPVHLNVPVDIWKGMTSEVAPSPATYRPSPHVFDRQGVADAARLLLAATRPVLLVGSGASSAESRRQVVAVAQQIDARVATTPRAKGVFPEDHPQSLGVFGFAGHPNARTTLLGDEVDVVFTVGASLGETSTFNWDPRLARGKKLIQLDIDVDRIGRNFPVDVPLVGDASAILLELFHQLRRSIERGEKPASSWWNAPSSAPSSEDLPAREPLHPGRWRQELNPVLPENAVVFSDIGGHMLFNIRHLRIREGQRFVLNLGFGSMGHGTAGPIGAKLACPEKPVLAIVGDACVTMNGMELLTALEYDVPVVWIVENNQMHGITWHGSKMLCGRHLDGISYKKTIPIAEIARAMGLHAEIVSQPGQIAGALATALAANRPALIDVRIDRMVLPPVEDRVQAVAGLRNA